jgi:hypothetical protein
VVHAGWFPGNRSQRPLRRSRDARANQSSNSFVSLPNNILVKDRLLRQSVSASARLKQDFHHPFLVYGL